VAQSTQKLMQAILDGLGRDRVAPDASEAPAGSDAPPAAVSPFVHATPDLVVLVGYTDGELNAGWSRLYRDWAFRTWLLINAQDVIAQESFTDRYSPLKECRAVWLQSRTKVGRGDARAHNPMQTGELQYLTGDFITAEEAATPSIGSPDAPGLFTDVTSAECCSGRRPATSSRFMTC
jgi:hypothetical protein